MSALRESFAAVGYPDLDEGHIRFGAEMARWRARAPLAQDDSFPDGHPLHAPILQNVYAFGATLAQSAGLLCGLSPAVAEDRADWAGRFNVGISLFDYACDVEGGSRVLAQLDPFRELTGAQLPAEFARDATLAYLQVLAAEVLIALHDDLSRFARNADDDPLWVAIARMLRAELFLADRDLVRTDPALRVERRLFLKAAEPFRVMVEWITLSSTLAMRRSARDLGRAIGRCVWVVDDAHDVWLDLRARQSNLFILKALAGAPSIALDRPALAAIQAQAVLGRDATVRRESRRAITRLVGAAERCGASEARRVEQIPVVAASLINWV